MKNKISLIYKILILIISGIGLYLNFDLLGIKGSLPYFTIQSNIFCFALYLVIIILELFKKLKNSKYYYIFKGMATMAITTTMLVFQLMIAPNGLGVYENSVLACEIVHLIVPLMIILDYFIFAEKGNIKRNYPFYWSLILIAYLVFVIIYASFGGTWNGANYPYFFLNIDKLGLFNVIIYCLVIIVFYLGCGFIAFTLDQKLAGKDNN